MAASSQLPGANEADALTASGAFEAVAEPPATYGGGFASSANVAVYGVGQITSYLGELLDTDPFLSDLWIAARPCQGAYRFSAIFTNQAPSGAPTRRVSSSSSPQWRMHKAAT